MTALYITFLIVGLTMFVLAMFGFIEHDFDTGEFPVEDFDLGHEAVGDHVGSTHLFSIRTISAFLAGFGLGGILAKLVLSWGIGGQLLLGFIIAFAFGALAYSIMRLMYSQQGGEVRDIKALIGKQGIVVVGTGDQGIGECRVNNHYYTCVETNAEKLLPNNMIEVVAAEVGLLIVKKI